MQTFNQILVVLTDDIGNIYVGGRSTSANAGSNNFIIKFNSNYDIIWQKQFATDGSDTRVVVQFNDNHCNTTFKSELEQSIITCKISSNGNLIQSTSDSQTNEHPHISTNNAIIDSNGNSFYVSQSAYDQNSTLNIIITKMDSYGNSGCNSPFEIDLSDFFLSKSISNSVSNIIPSANTINFESMNVTDVISTEIICENDCSISVEANVEIPCTNLETQFSSNIQNGSSDLTIQWDISNGETRNTPSFSLIFDTPREHSVSLNLTDNITGCTVGAYQTFTIQNDQLEELTDCNTSTEVIGIPETFDLSGEDFGESYEGTWSIVSENGGEIDNINSPETVVSNLGYGEYVFNWNISNLICNTSAICSHTLLILPLEGCTLNYATNYNPEAVDEDGSCEFDFTICDCDQNSHSPDVFEQLGDEIPNDDINLNFNCETWGYDCGDISGAPNDDPFDVCNGNFPENNGCPCLPGELDLSMGISQFINDTTEIDGQLIIDHVCLNVVNVIPTISGNCSVIELCFAFEDGEYSCLNLPEIESEYFSGDLIEFRTTVEAQQAHFYYTTESGTSDTYSIHIPQCSTGIQEEIENHISIYPNPASHIIYVQTQSLFSSRAKLTLVNSLGKEVKTIEVNQTGLTTIELEELSNGIYFLRLSVDRSTINTQKIVVQGE